MLVIHEVLSIVAGEEKVLGMFLTQRGCADHIDMYISVLAKCGSWPLRVSLYLIL